jgi:hypothetical protein
MKKHSILIRTAVATALLALGAGTSVLAQEARGERGWDKGEPMDVAAMQERIAQRAAAIDANGDGIITAEEMLAYRDAQRLQREQRRLQRYDRSGDGVVTVEDYVAARSERIARMDADGDGVITREEMREAHKAMRDGRGMHRGGHRGH